MRLKMWIVAMLVALAPVAAFAQCPAAPAQPVPNPKNLCFDPGPNYAQADGFKVKIKTGSTVLTTVDVGKPALTGGVVNLTNWSGYASVPANGALYVAVPVVYIGALEVEATQNGNSFFTLGAPGTAVSTP